jgi:hypothetical protein
MRKLNKLNQGYRNMPFRIIGLLSSINIFDKDQKNTSRKTKVQFLIVPFRIAMHLSQT